MKVSISSLVITIGCTDNEISATTTLELLILRCIRLLFHMCQIIPIVNTVMQVDEIMSATTIVPRVVPLPDLQIT